MKKRTRVFAWIFSVGASCVLLHYGSMTLTLFTDPPKVRSYGDLVGAMIPIFLTSLALMIGWIGLLSRRIWAWWLLVSVLGALTVEYCAGAVVASFLLKGRIAVAIALLVLQCILPLWVLLTDKPKGWSPSANPQSEIPNPK